MSVPVEPELRKQLRLAVVMNGGVSLAVWMSGATHELNNCRLGDVADENSDASRRAWAAILARAGIDVVVDVVAGASAGGLNGTVLAKAVATGRDLPAALRTLWFEQAALSSEHLLFDPPNPKASLLNGRYFHDRVTDLLRLEGDPVKDDDQTMTLLVTATALPIAAAGGGAAAARRGGPGQPADLSVRGSARSTRRNTWGSRDRRRSPRSTSSPTSRPWPWRPGPPPPSRPPSSRCLRTKACGSGERSRPRPPAPG